MKLSDLLNFAGFYDFVRDQKLPLKTSFKLTKIAKLISENAEFYKEKMDEIADEYGKKDEEGNLATDENGNILIREGVEEECNEKLKELQNFEIPVEYTFTVNDFDGIELTLAATNLLVPFIEE